MKFIVIGASHHETPLAIRERLAFSAAEVPAALDRFADAFPDVEATLLSTCNRVELYVAAEDVELPGAEALAGFLAKARGMDVAELRPHLFHHAGEAAARHLFLVTASLDSMVLGEPQILAQVKQAYQAATDCGATGPLLHAAFQTAIMAARRVAAETLLHQRRVSIPSVAVADFARRIFEQFDDKHVVVIGAGEMAEETLRYLCDEGAHQITVINRHVERADELAARWKGRAVAWDQLTEALATADLVVSTTAAGEPIVDDENFARIARARHGRPLFILDLAVPRDFAAAIGQRSDVYLYTIDDLKAACDENRKQRDRELPAAIRIIEQETARLTADCNHRASQPVIEQLRRGWQKPKEDELRRLLNKLPQLDERGKEEVRRAFDRLVNKLLHPPMESLRDESRRGVPSVLLEALAKLFRLKD